MSLVANPRPPASGTVPMRVIIQLSFITLFEEYEGEVNMTVSGAGDTVSTPSVRMKASRVTVADGLINENNYQVCIKGNGTLTLVEKPFLGARMQLHSLLLALVRPIVLLPISRLLQMSIEGNR